MPSRRTFLAAASGFTAAQPQTPVGRTPNILYLHSHDTGRYLQPYGQSVPTPNLQRLAGAGVLFRRAFSCAPTCSPSRAALLTGQFAHQCGMIGLAHRGFGLNDYKKHIVHTLRDAGYQSVLAGLQHVAAKPETIGYDELLRPKSTRVADVAPAAVAFLDRKPTKPFFLDVGFFETHREFAKPTPADDPRYTQPPMPIPDTPATRADMAAFHASARILDQGVGQVLEALERNGLAENTIVVSTTDHGIAFPLMKCNLTDSGFGVSLIVRGPGVFSGGKVCDAMVSHIDVFPTLCETLHIQPPSWLEGKSFLPVLRGEGPEINEEVFAEVTYHASYEPKRAVRTQRYKYIRRYGDRTAPVLPELRRRSKQVALAGARMEAAATSARAALRSRLRPDRASQSGVGPRVGENACRDARPSRWLDEAHLRPAAKRPGPRARRREGQPRRWHVPQEPVIDAPVQRK